MLWGAGKERNTRQRNWGTFSRLVVFEQEEMSSRVLAQTTTLEWGIQGVRRLMRSPEGWWIYGKAHVMVFIKDNAYCLGDLTA